MRRTYTRLPVHRKVNLTVRFSLSISGVALTFANAYPSSEPLVIALLESVSFSLETSPRLMLTRSATPIRARAGPAELDIVTVYFSPR